MIKEKFNELIDMLEHENFREITAHVIDQVPDLTWEKPSSSTGKYHPEFSNKKYGLLHHTEMVVHFSNYMAEMEDLNSYERDYLLSSAILHDAMKYGLDGKSEWTISAHPILTYKLFDCFEELTAEMEIILSIIEVHHGKWTHDRKGNQTGVLMKNFGEKFISSWDEHTTITKKRAKLLGKLLHQADFFASRRGLFETLKKMGVS